MAIRKNTKTGIWNIDISISGAPRYQKSSFTANKKQAQELHDKVAADIWRQVSLGEKPKTTWAQLRDLWIETKTLDGKRSLEDDRDKLRWLEPHFGNGKMLITDIDAQYINSVLDIKRHIGKPSKQKNQAVLTTKPISNATINRYASLIKSMLELAKRKELLSTVPPIEKLKEVKERISYLTHEQASDLLKELPDYLVPLVRFALATGLRQDNVTHLEWSNVDLPNKIAWAWADEAKGGDNIQIPLNDDALEVLTMQKGKSSVYVFPNSQGIPYPYPAGKAWKSALRRCGIADGFRWHDLRHTWATWHVQSGTPLEVLQKLGGWKSYSMVLKYAHLSASHLASHATNIRLPSIAETMPVKVKVMQISCEDSVNV